MILSAHNVGKIFSRKYRELRSRGSVDRNNISKEDSIFADLPEDAGRGDLDPKYGASSYTAPYGDGDVSSDASCDQVLKGANRHDR